MTDEPVVLVSMEDEPDVQRDRPFYRGLDDLGEAMITLREVIVYDGRFARRRFNPVLRQDEWDFDISAGQIARDFLHRGVPAALPHLRTQRCLTRQQSRRLFRLVVPKPVPYLSTACAGLSPKPSGGLEPSTPSLPSKLPVTERSRAQRFPPRFRGFGGERVAVGCAGLRPLCSTTAPRYVGCSEDGRRSGWRDCRQRARIPWLRPWLCRRCYRRVSASNGSFAPGNPNRTIRASAGNPGSERASRWSLRLGSSR